MTDAAKPAAGTRRRTKEQASEVPNVEEKLPAAAPAKPERLVIVHLDEQGNFTVQQQGLDLVAVPTLLKLAARQVERQMGV